MEFKGSEISIVQNFTVTSEGRYRIFSKCMERYAEVLSEYPFLVNFDYTEVLNGHPFLINFNMISHGAYHEKVRQTYDRLLGKVYFQTGNNKNWAKDTLSLVDKTDSPYIAYLMEDSLFDKNFTFEHFKEMFDEFKKHKCKHLLMGKVGKYSTSHWYAGKNIKNLKHLRVLDCNLCPYSHKTMSLVAIWERELFIECLKNTNNSKGLAGMDNFEIKNSFSSGYNIACPNYKLIDHVEEINNILYKERR